ncbi:MAG: CotH kinase family protein, partial [Pirellulales bacterium]
MNNPPETDVGAEMHRVNASAYIRVPFTVEQPGSIVSLQLRTLHDDGFVAYLNGAEVARRNAPRSMSFNSWAGRRRTNPQLSNHDVSAFRWLLQDGDNVLTIQLINPDRSAGFQIDAGLRIRGGVSRLGDNPKHAFRLLFRGEYGAAKLNYPLFGSEGVGEFDNIDLRTATTPSWSFCRPGDQTLGCRFNTMVRDVTTRDTQGDMGQPYTRSRYYHLYLNGQYWGLFQTQERAEASFAESYFGGDKKDYDVVKHERSIRATGATDGNLDAWRQLWTAATAGFADDEAYYRVQGLNVDGTRNPDYPVLLDVDDLAGWFLSNDSRQLDAFVFPRGTTIDAGAYLVIDASQTGLTLDGLLGGELLLVEAAEDGTPLVFVDHVRFDGSLAGVSLGRFPNADSANLLVPLSAQTFGEPNARPLPAEVVVSEVHYRPILDFKFASVHPGSGRWRIGQR